MLGAVVARQFISFKLELLNAYLPIEVTELGIVIEVNLEQLPNALSPIEVTELGIVIDVKLEQ